MLQRLNPAAGPPELGGSSSTPSRRFRQERRTVILRPTKLTSRQAAPRAHPEARHKRNPDELGGLCSSPRPERRSHYRKRRPLPVSMGSVSQGPSEQLDLLRRIEGQRDWLGLDAPISVLSWIGRQRVRARPHPMIEDRADQLTRPVHRTRRDPSRGDRHQQVLDLTDGHLMRCSVDKRQHDPPGRSTAPRL
jgi:hypothetical protein